MRILNKEPKTRDVGEQDKFSVNDDLTHKLYRIKVKLTRQTITTYGTEHPLMPGMTLEADVIQDRRKIWEWIAEPLLAVAYR